MGVRPVPLNIPLDFCLPKWGIRFWNMATSGAAVPEAAVHKDRNLFFEENKIGIARKCAVMHLPPADPSSNQCKPEAHFRGAIISATNATEVLRRSDSYAAEHSTREMLAKGPFHLRFQFDCFCLLYLLRFWLFGFFFTAVEYQYLVPVNLSVRRRKVGFKLLH
jgi:hypothetical protein